MIERLTDYPGYLIRWTHEDTDGPPILLLHGFPGNKHLRNLDLAYLVHQKLKRNIYILHYKGLGESPGDFSFVEALKEVEGVLSLVAKTESSQQVDVVGHSWGGLVGIYLGSLLKNPIRRLMLISPLVELVPEDEVYHWVIKGVREEFPELYGRRTEQEVAEDVDQIAKRYAPIHCLSRMSSQIDVKIVQAKNDDVTLTSRIRNLLPHFPKPPLYAELDQDHAFTQDRQALAREMISFLK